MCIGFYGCYAYAKKLSYRHGCTVVLYFVFSRQWQKRRKLECAALFRAAVSATLLFFFLYPLLSKHKEVRILAVYCFFLLDLHFATTQACFCKDVQHVFCKNIWRVYILRGVRTWKSYTISVLTSQTETDFKKCDLNRIPDHIRM